MRGRRYKKMRWPFRTCGVRWRSFSFAFVASNNRWSIIQHHHWPPLYVGYHSTFSTNSRQLHQYSLVPNKLPYDFRIFFWHPTCKFYGLLYPNSTKVFPPCSFIPTYLIGNFVKKNIIKEHACLKFFRLFLFPGHLFIPSCLFGKFQKMLLPTHLFSQLVY